MKVTKTHFILFLIIIITGSSILLFLSGLVPDINTISGMYFVAEVIVLEVIIFTFAWIFIIPDVRHRVFSSFRRGKSGSIKKKKAKKLKTGPVQAKKEKKSKSSNGRKKSQGNLISSMKQAISFLNMDLKKATGPKTKKKTQTEKIDKILDQSIIGEIENSLAKRNDPDPFSEFEDESISTDLFGDIDFGNELVFSDDDSLPSLANENISKEKNVDQLDIRLSDNEDHITIDTEENDEVADILDAYQEEIDVTFDDNENNIDSISSGLEEFDDIDLNSFDFDGEIDIPTPAPETPLKREELQDPQLPEPMQEVKFEPEVSKETDEQEMVLFSGGFGADDDADIMASLKSEVTVKKTDNHKSLIRELEGVEVTMVDLEKELESVCNVLNNRHKRISAYYGEKK